MSEEDEYLLARQPARVPFVAVGKASDDVEAMLKEHSNAGANFRCIFYFFLFAIVAFLLWARLEKDFMEPLVEVKERAPGEVDPLRAAAAELQRQYKDVKRAQAQAEGRDLMDEEIDETDVEELDHHEIKNLVKKRHEQLSRCEEGVSAAECKEQSKALVLQYNQLSVNVEKDFYKALGIDARADPATIRRAYEEAKSNPDLKKRDLAIIKEAHDVLLTPETRLYYNLYGQRPPESMTGSSARSGGSGQQWALGTARFKIVEAWMKYFGHSWWSQLLALLIIFAPPILQMAPKFYSLLLFAQKMEAALTGTKEEEEVDVHRVVSSGRKRR